MQEKVDVVRAWLTKDVTIAYAMELAEDCSVMDETDFIQDQIAWVDWPPVIPGTLSFTLCPSPSSVLVDDGNGNLLDASHQIVGTINYESGTIGLPGCINDAYKASYHYDPTSSPTDQPISSSGLSGHFLDHLKALAPFVPEITAELL